ncbi:hypothetical protein [uncultured virus]|uniref:Uncharacterized protein n=1 Tax=uncultured virus TaxID=340016 RepID=A0A218MM13_9VIRU|nr:hypothetical protein [uncultured virus]|tara:strand:+ start:96 stop:353 length:258 start_codon:yes stop_codon:yes gene_type:complete
MNRMKMINQLGEYFTKKGKYLELNEYNLESDTPMRSVQVKRVFNSWSRMMTMVKNYYPNVGVVVKKVTPKVTPKKSTTKKVKKDV